MELPKTRTKPEFNEPKLMIVGGLPKCGKSTFCASLPETLIVDLEDGYRNLECMRVNVDNLDGLRELATALIKEKKELGSFPYKRLVIDNASRLEEIALTKAAELYRNTAMGMNWGYLTNDDGEIVIRNGKKVLDPKADVRKLGKGAGYLYLREALEDIVKMFQKLAPTVILVVHIKDKYIEKDGKEITVADIDLAGKTGSIIAGLADGIGLMYREENKAVISFKNGNNTIFASRFKHINNKNFVVTESDDDGNVTVNYSEIFPNN